MSKMKLMLALAIALGAGSAVAADKAADAKKADETTTDLRTVLRLVEFGKANKDPYVMFAAYRMLNGLQPAEAASSQAKSTCPENSVCGSLKPAELLEVAAKFAADAPELKPAIGRAREEAAAKKAYCYYEWWCNYYGYCFSRWICL